MCADTDDTPFVEVLRSVLAYVRDVGSEFLGSALGLPDLGQEFIDMYGSEDVPLDHRVHARIIGARGKAIRKIMDEFKVSP